MVLRSVCEKRHGGKDDVCVQTAMNIPNLFVSNDITERDITMKLCTIQNKIMILDNKRQLTFLS
jgi:hypothetical protein